MSSASSSADSWTSGPMSSSSHAKAAHSAISTFEVSHWSDSEDEDDEDYEDDIYDDYNDAYDGVQDGDWDTRSIVTDEIELETAEQMFVTLMASMTDLLNPSPQRLLPTAPLDPPNQQRRHAMYEELDEPPQTANPTPAISNSPSLQCLRPPSPSASPATPTPTPIFVPTFHPFDADFAFDTDDDADLQPPPQPPRLPHSVSMPLPTTEPPPWHQPRGHTPEPQHVSRRPSGRNRDRDGDAARFSVALARMGDWEARNATAVAREVYRRHAADVTGEGYAQSWCAGDDGAGPRARAENVGGRWETSGTFGSRRHGMIGDERLRLGVAFVEGRGGEPAVTVGRGIAYQAEERKKGLKLFGFLRRRKDSVS